MADLNIAPIEASAISATEKVFDTLYDAVVSIALPPGTRVSENEIAKQLGVSRQPVRDAAPFPATPMFGSLSESTKRILIASVF